ncbi:MAG: DUF3240 family protein [Giesbergeria sp.]|nr:DUF3240 family protein [Giesbergeria sp.]
MNSMASRPQPDCLLTLAVPQTLEEEILDVLWAHPELVPGFTVLHGQGMGAHVALASSMEQVQGRARRVLVQVALQQAQLPTLIGALKQALPNPQIAYWVVPLLEFGRFGDLA